MNPPKSPTTTNTAHVQRPIAGLVRPIPVPIATFPSVMQRDPRFPFRKVAFALSGGGSKGDFEVGALRYLHEHIGRPAIVTGTSVGSINATVTAVGAANTQEDLESIWLHLHQDTDMYVMLPEWIALDRLFGGSSGGGFSLDGIGNQLVGTATAVEGAIAPVAAAAALTLPALAATLIAAGPIGMLLGGELATIPIDMIRRALSTKSIFSLQPIRDLAIGREIEWSPTGPGLRGAGLAAARKADGRILIVARGVDDQLYWRQQVTPGGDSWSEWIELGGPVVVDPQLVPDGRGGIAGVVAVLADGTLATKRLADAWDADWTALGGGPVTNRPTIATREDGFSADAVLFASDANRHPTIRDHVFVDAPWHSTGSWDRLAGAAAPVDFRFYGMAVIGSGVIAPPQRFTVLARVGVFGDASHPSPPSGQLFHLSGDATRLATATWDIWPMPPGGASIASDPVLCLDESGLVQAFVRTLDGSVWRRRQTDAGRDVWGPWDSITGVVTSNVAVGHHAGSGRIALFARGSDFSLVRSGQNTAGAASPFDPWTSLGAPPGVELLGDPVVVSNTDGRLQVFAVGNDLQIWTIAQNAAFTGFTAWQPVGGTVFTGIQMRLATVQLESGDVRHINEAGVFVGAPGDPLVPRAMAAMASSSIPAVFEPVMLGGNTYVDGGIRSTTPIQAAIDAGADEVFAVIASNPEAGAHASFANATLVDIALRGLTSIAVDAIQELELTPPTGFAKPVRIIQPSAVVPAVSDPFIAEWLDQSPVMSWNMPVPPAALPRSEIHDAFTIEPGLIRISIDYGYMRAFDAIDAPVDQIAAAKSRSDSITVLRTQIWTLEEALLTAIANFHAPRDLRHDLRTLDPRAIDQIRALKAQLFDLVGMRRGQGEAVPDGADAWATGWEFHRRPVPTASPFDAFETFPAQPLPR